VSIAIVHDWLDTWRGGEQVLAELCGMFPAADLFALVDFLGEGDRARLGGRRARTSFLQRAPFARARFRGYLPLFPRAIESLDVRGYDLVLSSSHAFAKGVRTSPGQVHVCYCYTPMRYAWDLQEQYLAQTGNAKGLRGRAARALLGRLRAWDRAASARVTHFVAISEHIRDRIRRAYGRDATVIPPPVPMASNIRRRSPQRNLYVTVSQLVPYKRVDLIAAAFAGRPDRELVVIGDGPERAKLQAMATPNVRLVGRVDDAERDAWLDSARAFVFAAEEDFGIAPLEAQARGVPVIAYRGGATAETIRGLDADAPSGVLFDAQAVAAIADALDRFEREAHRIDADACVANAARFSPERFRRDLSAFLAARCPAAFTGDSRGT
jgi:glycosyltransferase involved in cell wall biosynthesis